MIANSGISTITEEQSEDDTGQWLCLVGGSVTCSTCGCDAVSEAQCIGSYGCDWHGAISLAVVPSAGQYTL